MPPADRNGGMAYAPSGWDRDEEVLDTTPGRRGGVVAAVLAFALLAGTALVVLSHSGRSRKERTLPAPLPSSSQLVIFPPTPGPVADEGPPPALMISSTLYMVRDGQLIAHRPGTIAETSVTVGDPAETGGSYLLAPDPSQSRIWVVKSLPARILVYSFDLPSLRAVRQLHIEGQIAGIDELNGELYLSASAGVVGIGVKRDGLLDWTPLRGGHAIVADRARNRLLLLDEDGSAVHIRAESPDLTQPGTSAPLPLVTGTFLIVDGRIWAGGRRDPRRRRHATRSAYAPPDPAQRGRSPVALECGVRGGRRAQLPRPGSDQDSRLWCVDARSGKVLHTWSGVTGPVVVDVRPGAAVNRMYSVPSGSTPVQLPNGICPG